MSKIKKIIENDERIINCKKNAKILFKSLKKTDKNIKLMHCQIKVSQKMGYIDWFDLYNLVKNENKNKETSNNLFELLLNDALINNASIIKFERVLNLISINFKISGEFIEFNKISLEEENKFLQDMKVYISNKLYKNSKDLSYILNLSKKLNIMMKNDKYNLIVDYIPNNFLAIKIINKNHKIKNLELKKLGYSDSQIKLLNETIRKPVGSLIICGEKESGLKTTLNSLLKVSTEENKDKKIALLNHRNLNEKEDFYEKNNVLKMTVVHEKDDTSESAQVKKLKILMKKDTDFIFVDELKKGSPVKEYRRICQSGYNITATMKAENNIDLINQLKESGMNKKDFSDIYLINAIMHQCLMPKVCQKCGIMINNFIKSYHCEKEKKELINFLKKIENKYVVSDLSNILIRNKKGCIDCNHIGISDMTVCAELIDLNYEMNFFLMEDKINEFYESYRKLSDKNLQSENFQGKNILEHALYKMLKGIICPLEIMKKFKI